MPNSLKNVLLLLIFLVISPFIIFSENKEEIISIEKFIELSNTNDKHFQEILIDELYLKYSKTLGLSDYDLNLSLSVQYDKQLEGDKEDGAESEIELSKMFKGSGATASIAYSTEPASTDNESDLHFSIIQPIAQNAFGKADRLKGKIIGIEDKIAEYQILEAYEEYYSSLIKLYYNWLSSYKNMITAQTSYKENFKLYLNTKEKFDNSIADKIDMSKSYLQLLSKEENQINQESQFEKITNTIKRSISYSENYKIIPADFNLDSSIEDFETEYKNFIESSRTYSTFELLDSKNDLNINLVYEDLMPYASLIGGYKLQGEGLNLSGEKEALAYVGVSINYIPGKGAKQKAKYEQAKLDKNKSLITNSNKKIKLKSELQNLYAEIKTEKKLVKLFQEKINSAKTILDGEEINYSQGRSDLNDLIEAVNDYEENKFEKISHLIKLNSLITDWKKLNDTLIKNKKSLK